MSKYYPSTIQIFFQKYDQLCVKKTTNVINSILDRQLQDIERVIY